MNITRRQVLISTVAAGSVAATGCVSDAARSDETPDENPGTGPAFLHGVASGDPMSDRVMLWTRVSGLTGDAAITWELATTPDFATIVRRSGDGVDAAADSSVTAARDHTCKIDVTGLSPATTYYYRFSLGAVLSPVGRTRTAPTRSDHLRFAVASCSKYHQAYWNSYADIAAQADLDAVIHLGDYIYEEDAKGSTIPGRELVPDIEIYSLAEYRQRHAFYKTDPDLQELHRQHPVIATWDDHEIADNCYYEGAHRHDEVIHGAWVERRAAAVRAFDEWMPVRPQATAQDRLAHERIWRYLSYGDLVDLLMIDARLIGRSAPVASITSDSPQPSNPLLVNDSSRSLLGDEQRQWLFDTLAASAARWKLIGNQVLVGQLDATPGLAAMGGGTIVNGDQWDGYRAEQQRLLRHLRDHAIDNVVVLTGDIHSSWAIDLSDDPHNPAAYQPSVLGTLPPAPLRALAVEFACPGIGSGPNETLASFADLLQQVNRHVRYLDAANRGYFLLDVTSERVQAQWRYAQHVIERNPAMLPGPIWLSRSGNNHLEPGADPAAAKAVAPPLAP